MLLFVVFILGISSAFADDPVVSLPSGQIRGAVKTTLREGKTFYAFLGIPFAAPPVGNLRFQPPQPVESWDGVLEAKTNTKICYQVGNDFTLETEDCLYLNVYSPVEPGSNANLPVMFSIYGGAFIHGYAGFGYNGPTYFLEQDVIVVTSNYRVGPFGFLSTGDAVVAGNMGLKDQQFALKWVQENIHLFGGDPQKVTIQGQSAGAASVTYQVLSPGSAGLFRAAIGESGSALCSWANQRHAVDTAYGVAAELDASFDTSRTSEELLAFLQSVDAKAIDNTADKYYSYAPVVEVEHEGAFITESMYESVSNGKINYVPLLIGINSEEQIAKAADLEGFQKTVRNYEKYVYLLADEDMRIEDTTTRTQAAEAIRMIYTQGLLQDNLTAAIQYFSDNSYVRAVVKYAELQSKYTDVYFYQFSYHGLLGGNNASMEGIGRVAHAEDTKYLWASDKGDLDSYPQSDITTLDRYVGFFANFVKTLNPTPEVSDLNQNLIWPKVTQDTYSYMDIDENLEIRINPREFSYSKWVELYETYGVKPFVSY
nr:carboxylesterase [Pharsalia antennata]